jgi:hypothetical protein
VAPSRDPQFRSGDAAGGIAVTASLPAYDLIPLPGEGPEDVVVGSNGLIRLYLYRETARLGVNPAHRF